MDLAAINLIIRHHHRTYANVQDDFSALTFTTGNNDNALVGVNNEFGKFRVIMPDVDFTNNNRPLILTLHGFANGDINAHKSTACYAEQDLMD